MEILQFTNKSEKPKQEKSDVVLLMIDVINDFDFEDAEKLLRFAIPVAENIAALKKRAVTKGIPIIYVNDNFGHWHTSLDAQVEHCRQSNTNSKCVVELLLPEKTDYFVLKAKHSGFFSTTLEPLLNYLEARTLILAGFATNICVLFTANDAYMRDYALIVPRDCVAANTEELHNHALEQLEGVLKADTQPSTELEL
ncbi:MAG: isochorismatase family cysteine hydrolase [Pseudomonadota bacterium]